MASEVYVKFFLDTANLDEIRRGIVWGIIDGVTTNPTLIAKEGVPVEDQVRKIADIVNGDISAEVGHRSRRSAHGLRLELSG